jgi:hypothetical protein
MMRYTALVILLATVVIAAVSGQSQRSPATLDDLLNEVRGLRTDLNGSFAVTTRVQLVVGRLQVQEQRIAALAKNLADVRTELRLATTQRERTGAVIGSLEDRIRSGSVIPDRKLSFEQELLDMHERLVKETQRENDLRFREGELSNTVLAEQDRWMTLNSTLDDLERALTVTR